MSFTRYGFPATIGTEADPISNLLDPYIHTAADRMNLVSGEFSIDVSAILRKCFSCMKG
jgi:hypothetical protein